MHHYGCGIITAPQLPAFLWAFPRNTEEARGLFVRENTIFSNFSFFQKAKMMASRLI